MLPLRFGGRSQSPTALPESTRELSAWLESRVPAAKDVYPSLTQIPLKEGCWRSGLDHWQLIHKSETSKPRKNDDLMKSGAVILWPNNRSDGRQSALAHTADHVDVWLDTLSAWCHRHKRIHGKQSCMTHADSHSTWNSNMPTFVPCIWGGGVQKPGSSVTVWLTVFPHDCN